MFVNLIMKKFSRKDALKLMGLAGIASIGGTLINKVYGRDMKKILLRMIGILLKISPNFLIQALGQQKTHSFFVYIIMMCIQQQIKIWVPMPHSLVETLGRIFQTKMDGACITVVLFLVFQGIHTEDLKQ